VGIFDYDGFRMLFGALGFLPMLLPTLADLGYKVEEMFS